MNYSLLSAVLGVASALIAMERWASWRLRVPRRPRAARPARPVAEQDAAGLPGDPVAG